MGNRKQLICKIVQNILLGLLVIILNPNSSLGENWTLLRSGQTENYFYDKDSVIKIDKGIWQVSDASRSEKSTTKRQIRIDCINKKYAFGETIGWVGNKQVSHLLFNKNGWVWFDANDLDKKLIKSVCTAK